MTIEKADIIKEELRAYHQTGWIKKAVHKNRKKYTRKSKHKPKY